MEKHNEVETLDYIKSFLDATKKNFIVDQFYYLYWGSLIPVATFLSYLLGYMGHNSLITALWILIYVISFIVFTVREKNREKKVKTFAGRIYGTLWGGIFITALVFTIHLYLSHLLTLSFGLALIAGLLGTAYWIGGFILENRNIKILAVGWWVTCILLSKVPEFWAPACIASATVLFELIPGIIFHKINKKKFK